MVSSAARVDAASIAERRCFLCGANLPAGQRGLAWGEDYRILVNPYPIFPEHFTIPTLAHTDQSIAGRLSDMLDLARGLDRHVVFYNGPRSGASAPDHAHFQAGNKGFLPAEAELDGAAKETLLRTADGATLSRLKDWGRAGFLIESADRAGAALLFETLVRHLPRGADESEPGMNLLVWWEGTAWRIVVIARAKHRPDRYYAPGAENLLISPGAVDLGGVFVTPRQEDFEKITAADAADILAEVTLDAAAVAAVADKIKSERWNQK
jgi:hypothetical protein